MNIGINLKQRKCIFLIFQRKSRVDDNVLKQSREMYFAHFTMDKYFMFDYLIFYFNLNSVPDARNIVN